MKYVVAILVLIIVGVVGFYTFKYEKTNLLEVETTSFKKTSLSSENLDPKSAQAVVAVPVDAQKPNERSPEEKEDLEKRLDKAFRNKNNKLIQVEGIKYLVVEDLIVVPKEEFRSPDGDIIKKTTEYAVFLPDDSSIVPKQKKHIKAVLNTNNNQIGVVPGTLTIKAEDGFELEELMENKALILKYHDPDISVYYFQVKDEADVFSIANNLKEFPNIARVTIEIIESENKAM